MPTEQEVVVLDQKDDEEKRDRWEIDEDIRAIERVILIFRNKGMLSQVKKAIKQKNEKKEISEKAMLAFADGDLKSALGL